MRRIYFLFFAFVLSFSIVTSYSSTTSKLSPSNKTQRTTYFQKKPSPLAKVETPSNNTNSHSLVFSDITNSNDIEDLTARFSRVMSLEDKEIKLPLRAPLVQRRCPDTE